MGALDAEDVEEGEQVVEPRLAFDSRIIGFGPAGPAQVGTENAVAAGGDGRSDGAPLPPVLGESVQEHDRFALADGGEMSPQTGRLDDLMVEAGGLWQRRGPDRGVDRTCGAGLGGGHANPGTKNPTKSAVCPVRGPIGITKLQTTRS